MKSFSAVAAAGLLALASARPALAQGDTTMSMPGNEEMESLVPHVGFNVGGGVSFPLADTAKRAKVGGAFQIGVQYNFLKWLSVQAEYLYSGYSLKGTVLETTGLNGHHSMQYGDLNAIVQVVPSRPFGVYLVGGPGLYHRRVEITQFAGTAVLPYCDPWLFYCYTTPVSVDTVIGSRSRTDFGLNAGVGVSFRLFDGPTRLYLEGRYHYIFAGTVTTSNGGTVKPTGQYIPVVLGIRF
jgi:opacity protein-like surface antigen